jgi:hypothetical protein
MRKSVLVGLILLVAVLFLGCGGSPSSFQLAPTKPTYVLPSEFFLTTVVSRGPEGEIYIHGSTNLPDGMNIQVELVPTKVYGEVTIQNGSFSTTRLMAKSLNPHFIPGLPEAGNSKYIEVPFPPGRKQIHYHASFSGNTATTFNSVFQRPEVLKVVGEGGKNLSGAMFKETDPDVVDSNRILDYSQTAQFPPLTPEAEAINLVKRAVLTVPGMGKSSTDIDQNIQYNMASPGYHRGPGGWSAKLISNSMYAVSFDLITDDAQGHHQAIWSANLVTQQVKIVNTAAKYLSWTPNY